MSEYESLTIVIALISALISLRAIIVSRNTAVDQKKIAQRTQLLETRNLVATHHGKYSELLFTVQTDTRARKDRLAQVARDSVDNLCHTFDDFSIRETGRPTRHIFYDLCELIYQGFRPNLNWQTGQNLSLRFRCIRYVEDELKDTPDQKKNLEKRLIKEVLNLNSELKKDPNSPLEQRILSSAKFQLLLIELCERIPSEKRHALFQVGITAISTFTEAHQQEEIGLASAQKLLSQGLERNELEEFKLNESSALWAEYKRELAKLNILESFSLSDLPCFIGVNIATPIAELLYFGSLLFSIQMNSDWGDEN